MILHTESPRYFRPFMLLFAMHDCMSIICICFHLTNIISLDCYDTTSLPFYIFYNFLKVSSIYEVLTPRLHKLVLIFCVFSRYSVSNWLLLQVSHFLFSIYYHIAPLSLMAVAIHISTISNTSIFLHSTVSPFQPP